MGKFFIADTHLNHHGIIKDCDRPFKNVDEMNEAIIKNWNNKVHPGDVVYHVGDVAFPKKHADQGREVLEMLCELHGTIILIEGNHDRKNKGTIKSCRGRFAKVCDLEYIKIGAGQKVMLCHYPMYSWRARIHGSWHLFGHSHGTVDMDSLSLDVGVDCNNFTPLSEDDIIELMQRKKEKLDEHFQEKRANNN